MQQFDYERLDVYGVALHFVVSADTIALKARRGHGDLADQIRRASTSILLNLAEGAGEYAVREKARGRTGVGPQRSADQQRGWQDLRRSGTGTGTGTGTLMVCFLRSVARSGRQHQSQAAAPRHARG